ncbi:MAG: hypothetical protein ACYS0H_26830, partial [Planctomycetota bacterium]
KLEQCWEPGPVANSKFTDEEMAKITALAGKDISEAVTKFAPGWKVKGCGDDMDPGLREQELGKSNVLITHPLDRTTGCRLFKDVSLPAGKKSILRLTVGHHPQGDWLLIVAVGGREVMRKAIDKETAPEGWADVEADLSAFAGKKIRLELINQATGWAFEAGYWAQIELTSQ